MNFLRGLCVIILIGVAINMFKGDSSGSPDGIQHDWCKDRKCTTCGAYIGCYGYKFDHNAGLVIGPDYSLTKCRKCADNRE